MSLKSCVCEKRKCIFGVGAFVLVLGFILIVVFTVKRSQKIVPILETTPLLIGRNYLPTNLHNFLNGNLKDYNFKSNLTEYYKKIHCDQCVTDLEKLRAGKVDYLFFVIETNFTMEFFEPLYEALIGINIVNDLIKKFDKDISPIRSYNDIQTIYKNKLLGAMLLLDGGHNIINDISILRMFYHLGVRVMSLSDGNDNNWITGYLKNTDKSVIVSEFGEEVVREMNRLGMVIDISGLYSGAMNIVINLSLAPVIASHSAAYGVYNHTANIPDETLDLLKNNDGIVMVTFDTQFLGNGEKEVTSKNVIDHINYIVARIGFDHVGIGSNFDNMNGKPGDLQDVASFPVFFEQLRSSNDVWKNDVNVKKLASQNFERVFKAVQSASNKLL